MIYVPIVQGRDEATALDPEHHLIATTHPQLNDPHVSAILARKGFARGPRIHKLNPSWILLRRAPRQMARGSQPKQHPQDNYWTVARLHSIATPTIPPAAF